MGFRAMFNDLIAEGEMTKTELRKYLDKIKARADTFPGVGVFDYPEEYSEILAAINASSLTEV